MRWSNAALNILLPAATRCIALQVGDHTDTLEQNITGSLPETDENSMAQSIINLESWKY